MKAHEKDPRYNDLPITWTTFPDQHWRSCSYCGSIHPDDLVTALKDGARLGGSDWKYGWPHKFYLEIRNPELDKKFIDSYQLVNGVKTDIKYGTRQTLHSKWYNDHLLDVEESSELWELIAQHSRIRFKMTERGLAYCAPYSGFQVYDSLGPNMQGTRDTPIPDWPK